MITRFILAYAAFLLSCSPPRSDINLVPKLEGGIMLRDFVWRFPSDSVSGYESDTVYYNRAFLVRGVYLDSAWFSERKAPDYEEDFRIYERANILEGFKSGNETYLVIFRDYRRQNFPTDPGSFRVILKTENGTPIKEKAIVNTYVSGFPSNLSWFPRHLFLSDDSLDLMAGNKHTCDSIRIRVKVNVDSSFSLDDCKRHFEKMKSLW